MTLLLTLVLLQLCASPLLARPSENLMHPHPKNFEQKTKPRKSEEENNTEYWNEIGLTTLREHLAMKPNEGIAKNVIIFLGDGMSVPTLAAARMFMGDENAQLSFDRFPYTAMSKTYCVDYQVPDSACTATAYLGGIKGNMGTIGVNGHVPYLDCVAMTNTSNHINSIAWLSQQVGKSTGLVTTTRVTHASPAGVYAHTSTREWEADTDIIDAGEDPTICSDIATQLVNGETGRNLNVIMGGGRGGLLPTGTFDDEGEEGYRSDGINLIEKWQLDRETEGKSAEYVWNRQQLLELQPETDYVLGLFESSHCNYNLERDQNLDPSLAEMTEAAIKVLAKNENGFFLFVEGGRIDTAHHETVAHKALDETLEFSKAIEAAVGLTNSNETLIVVTSDHAHTMSYGGYPLRGNNILGIAGLATDNLPFTTLNYAGGPGYVLDDGQRHDLSGDDLSDINYEFPVGLPLDSETHGGDDVVVFAVGPWAHLYCGVIEENVIPHIMAYASCVGNDETACDL